MDVPTNNYMNVDENIDHLAQLWQEAKTAEITAERKRLAIEERILKQCDQHLKEKGTNKLGNGLKIITRMNERWDQSLLTSLYHKHKGKKNFPFVTEFKPVRNKMTVLEEQDPEFYKELQGALTVTPAKPTFNYELERNQ